MIQRGLSKDQCPDSLTNLPHTQCVKRIRTFISEIQVKRKLQSEHANSLKVQEKAREEAGRKRESCRRLHKKENRGRSKQITQVSQEFKREPHVLQELRELK